MFDLVVDVPAYPQFLPWCQRAEVLSQEPGVVTARLHLAYAGVRHAFTDLAAAKSELAARRADAGERP